MSNQQKQKDFNDGDPVFVLTRRKQANGFTTTARLGRIVCSAGPYYIVTVKKKTFCVQPGRLTKYGMKGTYEESSTQ